MKVYIELISIIYGLSNTTINIGYIVLKFWSVDGKRAGWSTGASTTVCSGAPRDT